MVHGRNEEVQAEDGGEDIPEVERVEGHEVILCYILLTFLSV